VKIIQMDISEKHTTPELENTHKTPKNVHVNPAFLYERGHSRSSSRVNEENTPDNDTGIEERLPNSDANEENTRDDKSHKRIKRKRDPSDKYTHKKYKKRSRIRYRNRNRSNEEKKRDEPSRDRNASDKCGPSDEPSRERKSYASDKCGPSDTKYEPSKKSDEYQPPPKKRTKIMSLGMIPYGIQLSYRASGILPFATHNEKVYVLLCCEDRSHKTGNNIHKNVWMNPGGKREEGEVPAITAMREFNEETRGIFKQDEEIIQNQLYCINTPKYWIVRGKYVLYLCNIPFRENICEMFTSKMLDYPDDHHVDLVWVPYEILSDTICQNKSIIKLDGKELLLYSFFIEIMSLMKEYEGDLYQKK